MPSRRCGAIKGYRAELSGCGSRLGWRVCRQLKVGYPGEHGLTADALLAGPLGRSLCVHLLDDRLTGPGGRVQRAWADAPGQWAGLVDRYPLDVGRSRRHDWWRATGLTGRWLIPDYAAVATDWDAIHVSVAGYLATAGVATPVGAAAGSAAGAGARTMLAGWDPDATWWLNDVLSLTGPSRGLAGKRRWVCRSDGTSAVGRVDLRWCASSPPPPVRRRRRVAGCGCGVVCRRGWWRWWCRRGSG